MAKAISQNIPSVDLHLYTRGLTQIKLTGYNYFPGLQGYGYGGIISTRIPFRLRRWQDKHATYLSSKRRKARDVFKTGVYNWHGTPYEYGTRAPNPGVKNKKFWWGIAEKGGFQYFRLFQSYTLKILHQGIIPDWLRIYELEQIGFGNWYFGGIENMYIARAYLSTDQENLTRQTPTKVLLDTISFDAESCFDLVNHRYIAPVSKYYQISCAITFTQASVVANKRYDARLYKNGELLTSVVNHSACVAFLSIVISDIVYLEKDDYIELWTYVDTDNDTTDILGSQYSTFLAIAPLPL